jgi:hypothetical protein
MKRMELIAAAMLALAAGHARAEEAYPPPDAPQAQPVEAQAAESAGWSDAAPAGQWVYTEQYGWIWMPYGDAYSYVPPDAGEPYEYVYYPAYGWTWVVAPWIWGYGPWPYFGIYGAASFGWYGLGYWRTPWRWNYRPAPFPGRIGTPVRGFRPNAAPGPGRTFGPRPAPRSGFSGFAGHPHSAGGGGHARGGHR